jgi:hypothetical protein
MAISVTNFTGSETVSTTEHSLTTDTGGPDTDTTVGIYQAFIDFNALAAGDVFEFKVYEKARAADTQRLCHVATIANAQTAPLWASPSLILGAGWDMTLKKISGTDRAITWSIRGATA